MEVRLGLQGRTHTARQRVHLVQTAAAFYLTPIALHTHLLTREIQRNDKCPTQPMKPVNKDGTAKKIPAEKKKAVVMRRNVNRSSGFVNVGKRISCPGAYFTSNLVTDSAAPQGSFPCLR